MKTTKQKCLFIIGFILALSILFFFIVKQLETNQIFYGEGDLKKEGTKIDSSSLEKASHSRVLEQTIKSSFANFCKIKITLQNANYQNMVQDKENIKITLLDENGTCIKEETLQYANYIAPYGQYPFCFPIQKDSKGKNYKIRILMQNAAVDVQLVETETNLENIEEININGTVIENTVLEIQDYYLDTTALVSTYILFLMLSILAMLIAVMLYERENWKPEKVFLYVVPLCCILFALVMPISKSHDETFHWYKVYEQAEGRYLGTRGSSYLPKGVIGAFEIENPKTKITTYASIFENTDHTIDDQYIQKESTTATYSPITYLPQIIGVKIASLFTNNAIIIAYIARFSNIAACMFLLYLAIQKIPYGKNVILLLSMIPIAIEGFSTISADGIVVASSTLLIAYILKLRQEKHIPITPKQIGILSILSIIIAISKTVYLPIVGMLFLLPKEKFQTKKKRNIIIFTIAIVATLVDVGWYLAIGASASTVSYLGIIKKGILFANPIGTVQQIFYTIITRFPTYFNEIFGGKLGWNEYVDILIIPYIIAFAMFAVSITGKEKKAIFTKLEKLWIMVLIIAVIGLVFMAMFLEWSMPGSDYVRGVQGRYLIPILLPISLLLGGKFMDDSQMSKKIGIAGIFLQIYVMISIFVFHI